MALTNSANPERLPSADDRRPLLLRSSTAPTAEGQDALDRGHAATAQVPSDADEARSGEWLSTGPAASGGDGESIVVVYRGAIIACAPIFSGYAMLLTLQGKIKARMGITADMKELSDVFGVGVSCIFLGNLVFRLLHNIIFSCIRPRYRVVISFACMVAAASTLGLAYYIGEATSVAFVFVAYSLAGVAIGTFEGNLVSCLTPLGPQTKKWAIMGMPVGYNGMSSGSFWLLAATSSSPDVTKWVEFGLILFVALWCCIGCFYFLFRIPYVEFESSRDNAVKLLRDLQHARDWAWQILPNCVAMCANMFGVILLSTIALYVFDVKEVPLWPEVGAATVSKDAFLAIFNTCAFLGDFTSRRVVYGSLARFVPKRAPWFLVLTAAGLTCGLSKIGILAFPGVFLVLFGNGAIYATTTKLVDAEVPRQYNLIALSFWLFIGDAGAFTAANSVQPLRRLVGKVATHALVSGNHTSANH